MQLAPVAKSGVVAGPQVLVRVGERVEHSSTATSPNDWWKPNPNDSIAGRARSKQRPPQKDWMVWLIMAGRGFGKTRTGAEWFDSMARQSDAGEQLLLGGRTPADVRDYSLHGEGGLLTHHPDIRYEPSKRTLTWPNGVQALIRSGANPDEFRGFSGEVVWLDEFAAWKYPDDSWSNLIFGVRERDPRICITTTPRNIKVLRSIIDSAGTELVGGSSYENRANLSEKWYQHVVEPLEGTRVGRQEIHAELLADAEGALWRLDLIDDLRLADLPDLRRLVIGVDPQGTKGAAETGIVAAGIGFDGHLYVVEDCSLDGTPGEWGNAVVGAWKRLGADRIIAERNFGGEMVEHTLATIDKTAPVKTITASRGKQARAEPVAAYTEKGRVHHVGHHPALETELTNWVPGSNRSPNRLDAFVWAAAELMADSTGSIGGVA